MIRLLRRERAFGLAFFASAVICRARRLVRGRASRKSTWRFWMPRPAKSLIPVRDPGRSDRHFKSAEFGPPNGKIIPALWLTKSR